VADDLLLGWIFVTLKELHHYAMGKIMYRLLFRATLLASVLGLAACGRSDKTILHVIYTGSLSGYLEPCGCKEGPVGGFARLAAGAQDSLLKWGGSGLLIEAGDFAETYLLPGDPKNRYLLQAYRTMKYDAINVTAQDLISGLKTLKWAADSLGLPLISVNLSQGDSSQRPFPGWVIKKAGGRTVGIIGAGSIRPLELRIGGDPKVTFSDPETAIRQALQELRPKCDLVILLCDLNSRASREMAVRIPGIDIIISTMEVTPTTLVHKFGHAYVIGTSRKGKALTILTLRKVSADSLACGYTRTLLDSTFRNDPKVQKVVDEYKKLKPKTEPQNYNYPGEE
jgi:2',3'-cyclic-nucleotide 2'-phosphodiesterase (5'-nucleotidase family)